MATRTGLNSAWRVLVGRPLRASEVAKEQITPLEGLPALSLDALTSVASGPEAIIVVLAVAGAGALHLVLPITAAIVALLAILVFSYRQVIDAYPGRRRRVRGLPGQPRRARQPAGRGGTHHRLHADRVGVDRGRRPARRPSS